MTFSIGFGFQFASETLPIGEIGGASGAAAFAGTLLARNVVDEAGRKAVRSALGGKAPSLHFPALAVVTVWPRP